MPNNFDPTQYGATIGTSDSSTFDPTKYGAKPIEPSLMSQTPEQSAKNLGDSNNFLLKLLSNPIVQTAVDVAVGGGKQIAQTLQNIGEPIAQTEANILNPQGKTFTGQPQQIGIPQSSIQETNLPQQIGGGIANIAEYIAPAGDVAKGEEAINAASKGLPWLAGLATRLFGKAGLEAAQGGLTSYAQTGNPTDAITGALTFGLTKGATGTIGETAKAFNIPERMYETIFSKTADDFKSQWDGKAVSEMQKSNPEQFKQLVDSGIISAKDGIIKVDSSTAKQALDRGLKGSGDQMGTLVAGQLKQSELQAQTLAQNFQGTVKISYPSNLVSVLRQTANNYKNVADNKYTNLANNLADKLEQSSGQFKTGEGQLSGLDALTLRRFLDSMRTQSSFDKTLTETRATQPKNYKFLSDKVRLALNSSIPGMKDTMKDYSFQIKALDDLSSHMTKAGHSALVSMWDTMIFDVGLSGGVPGIGGALAIGRRYLGTAGGLTRTAQALEQGLETKTGAALKGAASDIMSESTPQQ